MFFPFQVVLDKNKPNIKTVVNKIDSIKNEYRMMDLEVLAGNHSLVTTVVENGIRFNLDLANMLVLFLHHFSYKFELLFYQILQMAGQ